MVLHFTTKQFHGGKYLVKRHKKIDQLISMKKLTLITFAILVSIYANCQTSNQVKTFYWFATGIEQIKSDLQLRNPSVVSEILEVKCATPTGGYGLNDAFTKYFENNYASSEGVTSVYLYEFTFETLAEAQTKRNEIITSVESKNGKICYVRKFEYKCN